MGVITSDGDLSCDLAAEVAGMRSDDPRVIEARNFAGPMLLLYAFDKASMPNPKRDGRVRRIAIDAVQDPIGAAFVFPKSRSLTPQGYKTVDLSGVPREEIEPPAEEEEDEGDEA
jgi:hypothetical protein